jgi:phage gp29-like protein
MTMKNIHQPDQNPTKNRITSDLTALAETVADKTRTLGHGLSATEEESKACEELWELRAMAARTPSRTRADLVAKARLALDEMERWRESREEKWNHGGDRDLLSSLAMDIIALKDKPLT